MITTDLAEGRLVASVNLRNEPVQARSAARLTALLDAAAAVIDEIGYERLTTAMVAERAGASIGTVYRYFPDRIAVLQALASRNLERVLGKIHREFSDTRHENWISALGGAFDIFVEAFRSEPGFRSIRSGDVLDLRPAPEDRTFNSRIAEDMLNTLSARFDLPQSDETRFAFETAIEVTDSLVARAFARNANGDQRFLDQGRAIVRFVLVEHFGQPES